MFNEVPSFQIYKLYVLLVLRNPDFLSIHLFQNAKSYGKWVALIINNFVSKYHLSHHVQPYRGRWRVFVSQIDTSNIH